MGSPDLGYYHCLVFRDVPVKCKVLKFLLDISYASSLFLSFFLTLKREHAEKYPVQFSPLIWMPMLRF